MYGCKADYSFAIKCLFKDYPLTLLVVFFFLSSTIYAYALFIAEKHLVLYYNIQEFNNFCNSYLNSLWLIVITITTVGYGDYYPHTPLGRIIIFLVALWGTSVISIMVVVVANTLNMQKNEKKCSHVI